MKPALKIVTDAPIDIHAMNRAEILNRDWSRCHIAGDRNPPLFWAERNRRTWRA